LSNIHFVGTLVAQGCGFTYDGANDGHGGALATNIVSLNELPGWLAVSEPDIVMMFLGTNDIWSGTINTTTILAAYTTLVGQMRAQNPAMTVMVAQITPMAPSGCSYCAADVIALNAAIPAWAAGISTSKSPVSVVNCFTGYSDSADTVDGVHPNDAGNTLLANDWFAPLSSAVVRVGGQAPVTTSAGATSTAVVSPAWGQCGKLYPVFLHLGVDFQRLDWGECIANKFRFRWRFMDGIYNMCLGEHLYL
jgi:lysophospholipase L1-like esterase